MRLDKLLQNVEVLQSDCAMDTEITDIVFDSRRKHDGSRHHRHKREKHHCFYGQNYSGTGRRL